MSWHETPKRSIVKSLTWRALATLSTITIIYILTGDLAIAGTAGAIEVVAKVIIYYLHDRVWNRIAWGVSDE